MNVTQSASNASETAPVANLNRAARRVFAVVSHKVSSAVERLVASAGKTPSEYYRFPWF